MKLRIRFPILVLGLATLGAVYLWTITYPDVPRHRWQIGSDTATEPFPEISQDTPISLQLDLPFPAHAYIASYNPTIGTIALFPSPWLRTESSNPLPAGSHRLPGTLEGKDLNWPAPNVLGPTSYMVVVSPTPVPQLDDLFARVRQIGNMAFADGSFTVSAPREGGMDVVPPRSSIPDPILEAAAQSLETLESQAMVPLPEDPDSEQPDGDEPPIYISTFRVNVVE